MRARWGHTSPVGRHLQALISDKGLSVPRTPALPHSLGWPPLPFQSHLSSPAPGQTWERPGQGLSRSLVPCDPSPTAPQNPHTPQHTGAPRYQPLGTQTRQENFGRAPPPSPGCQAPASVPMLPAGLWDTGTLQVCSETWGEARWHPEQPSPCRPHPSHLPFLAVLFW